MKKVILLSAAILLCSIFVNAQNKMVHEIGFTVRSLSEGFGLRYKIGNEKNLFRLAGFKIYQSEEDRNSLSSPREDKRTNYSVSIGYERIIPIQDQINIYAGPLASISYSNTTIDPKNPDEFITTDTGKAISGGIILGLRYNFNKHLSISGEITPNYTYRKSTIEDENPELPLEEKTIENYSSGFYFRNNLANICFAFRF